MPSRSPPVSKSDEKALSALGECLRKRRKVLKVSATAMAESAAMSRMTLYRIERGDPSVTLGAYMAACSALGLSLEVVDPAISQCAAEPIQVPEEIRIADFPELRRISWQLKKDAVLAPREAFDIYERNWRHIEVSALEENERQLIRALARAAGKRGLLV